MLAAHHAGLSHIADHASQTARAAIEKAGGTLTLKSSPTADDSQK